MKRVAVMSCNIGGIDEVRPSMDQTLDFELFYYTEHNLPFPLPELNNRMKGKYFKTQAHRKVCYTVIFGNYEELKEPLIVTPGWEYVCYTDQDIKSNVWKVVKVDVDMEPQKLARFYKIMKWTEWEQSIWIDASFSINVDLDQWWVWYFKKGFSASRHPIRNCIYDEGNHCIRINRGGKGIAEQLKEYESLGVERGLGLITSGLLMRKNTPEVIKLCNDWWDEMSKHSIRDQVSFGKVAIGSEVVHTYRWDYRKSNYFIYKTHFHYRPSHKLYLYTT